MRGNKVVNTTIASENDDETFSKRERSSSGSQVGFKTAISESVLTFSVLREIWSECVKRGQLLVLFTELADGSTFLKMRALK